MQGSVQSLIKIFRDYMEIPIYQRNYDWGKDNCGTLFNDLTQIAKSGNKKHFFGSIVRQIRFDETSLIIDGQQRITTVSLIICAMIKAAERGEISCDSEDFINQIRYEYLIRQYDTGRKIRLKPVSKDMDAFDAIVLDKPEDKWVEGSNVTRNYRFLYERVVSSGLSLSALYAAIRSLEVMDLLLDTHDDAQLIFESLNSTGLALSEADKVRNYMLMNLPEQEQKQCYENFWCAIEQSTSVPTQNQNDADSTTLFLRDYLTINTRRICRVQNVYREFKSFCESGSTAMTRPERLADMLTYAHIYGQVSRASHNSAIVRRKLKEIGNTGSKTHMPFMLQFFAYANENNIGEKEIANVIDIIEDYWIRRIICSKPSNALNKIFCSLHNDVLKVLGNEKEYGHPTSYANAMKSVILSKGGTGSFPKDEEVKLDLGTRQVYGLQKQIKTFLFDRLENENNKEYIDIAENIRNGETSIEHIMPQNLTEEWKRSLGDNWDDVANKYMHTLANLTLTGYNSEYSNKPFLEKRDGVNGIGGYRTSHFRLSETLKDLDRWTEKEIIERQVWMTDRFLRIFPQITSTISATSDETVSLADCDESLTGRGLAGYRLNGEFTQCSTWQEMLVSVCTTMLKLHPDIVKSECAKDGAYLRSDNNSLRPCKLAENCYVDTNNSTLQKVKFLQNLFNLCGMDDENLELSLKPVETDQNQ